MGLGSRAVQPRLRALTAPSQRPALHRALERRPHYLERNRYLENPVAKFRYNAKRGSWTLYWRDQNLRWHAYEPFEDRRDFLELLREVETDPTSIFWG